MRVLRATRPRDALSDARDRFDRGLRRGAVVASVGGIACSSLLAVAGGSLPRSAAGRWADALWSIAAAVLLLGAVMVVTWIRAARAARLLLGGDAWRRRRIVGAVVGRGVPLTVEDLPAAAAYARVVVPLLGARSVGLGCLALAVLLLAVGREVFAPGIGRASALVALVDEIMLLLLVADSLVRMGHARDYAAAHPVAA